MEKILLAEDNKCLRDLFEDIINESFPDYEVESFSEGVSLAKRLQGDVNDVKLVVTDNTMPGIYGSEIISLYAQKPKFKDIPFILCSGDISIRNQSCEDGAFDFITKPVGMEEYVNILSKALNQ